MKNSSLLIGLMSFLFITITMGHSKIDDEPQVVVEIVQEGWETEVEQVGAVTSMYLDFK